MKTESSKWIKVGIYLRLSDEDNDKSNKCDNSESIKNQRYMLLEEIKKRENFLLIDEYCDEDLSGAGTYRPEFERLIKDCESNKLDVVMCKSQSRFSRDMEIIEKYLHNKFLEWGVRFISLTDAADTDNIGNKKSRQINGLVNEWFLEDVSNNIRSAFVSKMKHGEFISPFAPFGYEVSNVDNNKLVVDNYASLVVKEIFNLYLAGFGFTGIAKCLNNNNVPSPSLYKFQKGIKLNIISKRPREEILWSSNAIKNILTNEIYLGHLIQGKRTTVSYKNHTIKKKKKEDWIVAKNTHEAIIDEEVFNKVNIAIKERKRQSNKKNSIHVFSGKIFCLECGRLFRKKDSGKHNYLVCSSKDSLYDKCLNNSIRYDILEDIILSAINKKIKYYCDFDKLREKIYELRCKILDDKIKELNNKREITSKKVIDNKRYLKNLYEDKVNNVINDSQFRELIKDYNNFDIFYSTQITAIDKEIDSYRNRKLKENSKSFFDNKIFENLNRFIIEEFIDKIYISKINNEINKRNIKIKWNF